MLTPELRRVRARHAAMSRHHPNTPELYETEQRLLKAGAAERYIRDLLATPPALTADERQSLIALLEAVDAA